MTLRLQTGLLLLLGSLHCLPTLAAGREIQDWKVEVIDANAIAAYTVNSSGGIFGKVCYVDSQTCAWVVTSSAPCETDGEYITLSNSAAGANLHDLTCLPQKQFGQQLMVFDNYDSLASIARQAGQVGFAFPIVDGQFRVFRFSLTGSTAAIEAAHKLAIGAGKSGTSDLTL